MRARIARISILLLTCFYASAATGLGHSNCYLQSLLSAEAQHKHHPHADSASTHTNENSPVGFNAEDAMPATADHICPCQNRRIAAKVSLVRFVFVPTRSPEIKIQGFATIVLKSKTWLLAPKQSPPKFS